MTISIAKRLGGLSCVISGVLLFLAHLLNLGASNGIGTVLGQTLVLSAHLLLVFAFFWLYTTYGSQIGLIGLFGMISGIVGTILVTEIVFVEIAGASGKELDAVFETSVTRSLHTFGPMLFVLGMILMGLSFLRRKNLPRGGGLLLLVGTLVFASGSFASDAEALISMIGAAFTGAGFVWLGMSSYNKYGGVQLKTWTKHEDPNNKYGATFTLRDRNVVLPQGAVISVTRGEHFNIPRLMINGMLNQFIMKAIAKNEDLLYAELTGQMQGGIGQTTTVWKDGKRMNQFRTKGFHNFARRFFSWVFYSGKVQSYFLTWEHQGHLPPSEEITTHVKTYGRHFDGGKMVKKANPPKSNVPNDFTFISKNTSN